MSHIYAIDHVQIAMPAGQEEQARVFYCTILGFEEIPKPAALAGRGGVWFEAEGARLHLGVEADFRPARKAHPAFLVDNLAVMIERCRENQVQMMTDQPLEGYNRIHIFDPFGNRIELMERILPE